MKLRKKALSIILVFAIVLSLGVVPVSGAAPCALSLSSPTATVTASTGQNVTVDVSISGLTGEEGWSALTLYVYFDNNALTYKSIKTGETLSSAKKIIESEEGNVQTTKSDGPDVQDADNDGNNTEMCVAIAATSTDGNNDPTNVTGNGTLWKLTFSVAQGLESQELPLHFVCLKATINGNTSAKPTTSDGKIIVNGVNPTIKSGANVTLDNDTVDVNGTTGGTLNAGITSKKGTDLTTSNGITWSVTPENQGVTIGANTGVITVDGKAKAATYTVTATADGTNVLKDNGTATATKTFTVTRNTTSAVSAVTVGGGQSSIAVPTKSENNGSASTTAFTATVTDQYGDTMSNQSVAWSIDSAPTGVTIDTNGVVTVKNTAFAGDVTVKATCGGKTDTATLTITKATSVPTTVTVSSGQTEIAVPADNAGSNAITTAFTATVYDQFGAEMSDQTINWSVTADGNAVSGVTVENGLVTVAKNDTSVKNAVADTTGKGFTVTATCGSASGTATLTIKRAESQATTLKVYKDSSELSGATDTIIIPSGTADNVYTYSAKVFDQYGKEMTSASANLVFGTTNTYITYNNGTVTVKKGATKDSTYTLTASYSGLSNKSITLTAKDIEITNPTVSPVSATYGMTWAQIVPQNAISGGSASLAGAMIPGTFTLKQTGTPVAGEQSFTLVFNSTNGTYQNIEVTDSAYKVTVASKPITATVTAASKTYGEANPAFDFTIADNALVAGDTKAHLGLTLACVATDKSGVGKYDVTKEAATNSNYNVTVVGEKALTINAKKLTADMVGTIESQTYTGQALTPDVTVTDTAATITSNDYTVAYKNNTNAGTATATITGKGNYTGTVEKTFTIKPKTITPTVTVEGTPTYSGKAQTPAVTVKDGDTALVLNTDYPLAYSNNTNAGTDTASVKVTAKSGSNYTFAEISENFSIEQKEVTAEKGTLVVTKQYNGDTDAGTVESGALALSGVIGKDVVTVSGTIGAYASANYGTGINVTISGLTLAGDAASNYTLSATSGTFAVGKITKIRVKSTDYSLDIPSNAVYNGAAQPLTATKKTQEIGNLTVLYNGSATAPTAAGTYAVTLKVAASTNYEAENGLEIGNYTIAQKEATLTWSGADNRTYDGKNSAVTATVSNLAGSDKCTVTVTGGTEKDAGTYTATATALSNANYKLPSEVTKQYIIEPKVLTKDDLEYKSGAKTKVYDGTTTAANIAVGVKTGVLASGDTLNVSGTAVYNSKDAAAANKITFTPAAITEGNYRLAATETLEIADATITKKPLTITGVKATDRAFTEIDAFVALTGGKLVGVVGSEKVDVTLGKGSMENNASGARKAVTTNIELTGNDAANYTLTQPTDVTVNIFSAQTEMVDVTNTSGKDATKVTKPETATDDQQAVAQVVGGSDIGGTDEQKKATYAIIQEASNAAICDQSKVNSAIEEAKNDQKINGLINTVTEADSIKIVAVPFIKIEVKDANFNGDVSDRKIKLEIDFMLQMKATVGSWKNTENTIDIGEPEQITVNDPVTISIPVPDGFMLNVDKEPFVKHNHNGKIYCYKGEYDSGSKKVTVISLYGLSEFTLIPTLDTVASIERTVSGVTGTLYFETLQEAVNEVADGETIVLVSGLGDKTAATTAVVSRAVSFTLNASDNDTGKYSITGGSGYKITESDSTYTVTKNASSGGGGTAVMTSEVSVPDFDNGTVTANPAKAKTGSTVTITVSPEEGYTLDQLTVTDAKGKAVALKKVSDTEYTFTMPAGEVSIDAAFVADSTEKMNFIDVKTDNWFYGAVEYVFEKGLMNGTGNDKFKPNDPTTRGMIFTILARIAGVDTSNSNPWYEVGMTWAKEQGISDGTMPMNNVTREQLATMLYRAAQKNGAAAEMSTLNFPDADTVSDWAKEAVCWCVENGIINGKSGKLVPTGNATRAEVATMLMRYLELGIG